MTEINKIMLPYVHLGPGKLVISKLPAEKEQPQGELEANNENAEQEQLNAKAKDYEYLLGMPMWNLTEEKIDELEKLMLAKKHEHDALKKKHHFDLWREDLEVFKEALTKQEEKDERDRLAHGGVKNEAKAKRKKPAVKNAAMKKENANTTSTASETQKPQAVKKPKPQKVVDVTDLPLRERLALMNKNTGLVKRPQDLKIEGKRTLKQADI